MQILIDLNVLLDVIQKREPHYTASGKILGLVAKRKLFGQIPAHALTTIHYIVAKYVGHSKAGQTIDWLLSTLKVIPAGQKEFIRARSLHSTVLSRANRRPSGMASLTITGRGVFATHTRANVRQTCRVYPSPATT